MVNAGGRLMVGTQQGLKSCQLIRRQCLRTAYPDDDACEAGQSIYYDLR